ncbi:MAG: hypothetical protein LBK67_07085 [Coriobacteriales bacterium]|nr:hypothetical protein [Coriobacteriales bacterium]
MSEITLVGWLKSELTRMSGQNTLNICKLATLAKNENPRLYEPLLIYAMETGALDRLLFCIEDEKRKEEYLRVAGLCGDCGIVALTEYEIKSLPWDYRKLLLTWKAVEGKRQRIERSKRLRLERTQKLQKLKAVSNVQIYRTLNLNPGNTNAYLKHGDLSKLSLNNATRIMKYLYAL